MEKEKTTFLFNKSNYILLIAGVLLNVIGFLLMIGGAAEDLNEFNEEELFSPVRLTVAPILIILGYAVIIYSIMKKPKISDDTKKIEE
ncbi:DUF3098 domain-containing protein [Brumimicrobium aurantiacum]|uniref:DUF3098 domain-containing protein n=1 Tax=Brumimicrobium aurantiacum TaxID=1737063 RepID=A0A3E1EVI3_9FLAO|nr:DUF3098 domain-containing protein [Brumimicrobium aurantiacum]RFC53557.1 DUF3098 domain-containing protein [Brumimicrobium aurantiacum]